MKYCPNCGAEYHDDVAICHDCQVALVDEPPAEIHEGWESIEPVGVHTAAAVIDAELIVGTLKANGVRAFAAGSGAEFWTGAGQIGQMTRVPGPLNEIRIMVHPDDEMQAREVLAAAGPDENVPEDPLPGMRWTLDSSRRARIVKVVALFLLFPILWGVVVGIAGLVELVRDL